MLQDVDYVIGLLKEAGIPPTTNHIETLTGLLSLGVFPPDQCIADLQAYIDTGAVWL